MSNSNIFDFEAISVEMNRIIEKYEETPFIGEDGIEVKIRTKTQIKEKYHEHHPCSYGACIRTDYPELIKECLKYMPKHPHVSISENQIEYIYRGTSTEDLQRQFYQDIKEIQEVIHNALKLNIPLKMSLNDTKNFEQATHCHICEKPL